jgi:hypothetical protein
MKGVSSPALIHSSKEKLIPESETMETFRERIFAILTAMKKLKYTLILGNYIEKQFKKQQLS